MVSNKKSRYVYLMECGGKYKVGVTTNIARRVKELDNRPFKVNVVARSAKVQCAFEAEREIHEWMADSKIDGEWFDLDECILKLVIAAVEDVDDELYGYEG